MMAQLSTERKLASFYVVLLKLKELRADKSTWTKYMTIYTWDKGAITFFTLVKTLRSWSKWQLGQFLIGLSFLIFLFYSH